MLKAIYGDFEIEVFDEHYRGSLVDCPRRYLKVFENDSDYAISYVGIIISLDDEQVKSALIMGSGGGTCVNDLTVIFEENSVIIACCDSIFCLSIPELSLVWKTKCDLATCFQLFKFQDDYIIHGELEISRLSHNGEIIWQQGGADNFTGPFVIAADHILATDWDGREYKFDFDGNSVS